MHETLLIGLVIILGLGVLAQWLAWRLRVPSILFLLLFGIVAGPVIHLLDVNEIMGDLLFPVVSLSVAIILFEGGLTLRMKDLVEIGSVLRRMLTLGVLVTWFGTAFFANVLLGFDFALSLLLGAILVVTGPTVVIPLLNQIRPSGRVASILRWEGIVIDPVGALLTVLIFEAVRVAPNEGFELIMLGFAKTALIGTVVGFIFARLLLTLMEHHWLPDYLENPATLFLVLCGFAVSNLLQSESGLLSVTIMGIILANQDLVVAGRFRLGGKSTVNIEHIVEFREILQVLLVSSLFILLSARLQISDLSQLGFSTVAFILALVVIIRPVTIWLCTYGSRLNWKERLFLAWMAPRGIVAAAIASIFTLELIEHNYANAELLAPVVFAVIIGTVVIYGLSAGLLAEFLGLSQANPQGVLMIGAHDWARQMASALQNAGFLVRLVDTNWTHIQQARMEGLPVYFGSVMSDRITEALDFSGMGHVLALTPNDDVNALACLKMDRLFGRANVYQLAPVHTENNRYQSVSSELRGRYLFDTDMHFEIVNDTFHRGAKIKTTKLTPEFNMETFLGLHGEQAKPLFIVDSQGKLVILTNSNVKQFQDNVTLISLMVNQE